MVLALVAILVPVLLAANGAYQMPPAESGVIDGKPALLGWPATLLENGHHGPLLSPDHCDVHLSNFDDLETEQSYPCGKRFLPKPNRYWIWLEQNDTVSAIQVQTLFTGIGNQGARTTYSMVPAGFVSTTESFSDDRAVRFLNLRPEYRAFQRSARGGAATTPMRIPTGKITGGIFDRKSGDLIAFFHPFELARGQRVRVTPVKQVNAGVFVVLKPPPVPRGRIVLALRVNGNDVPPDDMVDNGLRIYAFWYSVRGTKANLEVFNETVMYDGTEIVLRDGAVTTRRDDLKLRSRSLP